MIELEVISKTGGGRHAAGGSGGQDEANSMQLRVRQIIKYLQSYCSNVLP